MRKSGFSLIEVLAAMALALLLIVGTAEILTCSLYAKRKGDLTAALTQALTARLESLKARPFGDAALAPGEHAETARVSPGDCRVVEEWEVTDDGSGMKMVRIRVRSAGRPGPGTSAVLFISRDLGFGP
jgi:prepilin-type N-terminal cleavage/methylation domain-containing protein